MCKLVLCFNLLMYFFFFIFSVERMHEELIKRKDWCIGLEHLKADSSKRIGQSKTADESILGVEGNFKKLNFD